MNSVGSSTLWPPVTYRYPFISHTVAACLAIASLAEKVFHFKVLKLNISTVLESCQVWVFLFKKKSFSVLTKQPPATIAQETPLFLGLLTTIAACLHLFYSITLSIYTNFWLLISNMNEVSRVFASCTICFPKSLWEQLVKLSFIGKSCSRVI